MKLQKYLNEYDENKVKKLIDIFSNIPNDSPENIARYIINIFTVMKLEPGQDGNNSTYLSGPMTNLPDDNWPVFIMAEKYIEGKVFNPAKPHGYIIKKVKGTFTWSDFMVEDVYHLLKCDDIVVLPGWSRSMGAITEVKIGEKILNTKSISLRENIGNKKYQLFINDVKKQYYKDGNNEGYDSVIEPMLVAKTEVEASKYVKSYIPKVVNESIVNDIKDMIMPIDDKSVINILKIIGNILDKKYSRKIIR